MLSKRGRGVTEGVASLNGSDSPALSNMEPNINSNANTVPSLTQCPR